MSLRRAGRVNHLGVRTAHARKRVLALADEQPGRWPSSPKT